MFVARFRISVHHSRLVDQKVFFGNRDLVDGPAGMHSRERHGSRELDVDFGVVSSAVYCRAGAMDGEPLEGHSDAAQHERLADRHIDPLRGGDLDAAAVTGVVWSTSSVQGIGCWMRRSPVRLVTIMG